MVLKMLLVFAPIFVEDTKITFAYNFVAPLNEIEITMICCYKVDRKAITNPPNSYYPSFLLADIDSTDLLGAAHTFHRTVSIVTAQTNCHIALNESNHYLLASFATASQRNFAYLVGKLLRKKLDVLEKN